MNFNHTMSNSIISKAACLVLSTALLSACTLALAQDTPEPSPWSISGYGTLGYSQLQRDPEVSFVRDLSQRGPKTHRSASFRPENTRLGFQGAYRLSPQTDAVLQLVLRDKTANSVANSVEWAYVSHRPSEELTLRGGRLGIDVFLLSDYRNLGYAQTSVRPNWDYYGFMPIYSLDGMDATYTHTTQAARWSVKSQWGKAQATVPMVAQIDYDFEARGFWNLSVQREAGPWRLKAGYAAIRIANEAPLSDLTNPAACASRHVDSWYQQPSRAYGAKTCCLPTAELHTWPWVLATTTVHGNFNQK